MVSEIDRYLVEMEVPRRYIELMTDTSSNDVRWLEYFDVASIEYVPSVAEWIASACGSVSKSEDETRLATFAKKNLLPREKELQNALIKRSVAISNCGFEKIRNARDAIADFSIQ